MPVLIKNKFVDGMHGKGGGYKLNREPDEYRVGDILRLTEGNLAPVACLGEDASPCERASECRTLPMWKEFYRITNEFFDGVTVADLMKKAPEPDYYIWSVGIKSVREWTKSRGFYPRLFLNYARYYTRLIQCEEF